MVREVTGRDFWSLIFDNVYEILRIAFMFTFFFMITKGTGEVISFILLAAMVTVKFVVAYHNYSVLRDTVGLFCDFFSTLCVINLACLVFEAGGVNVISVFLSLESLVTLLCIVLLNTTKYKVGVKRSYFSLFND